MMTMITAANIARHGPTMEDVWSFRHRQFVDRFRWNNLRKSDGREIDEFDTECAIHLPLLLGGSVVGYTRFLRTDRPHLLSENYPELMGGALWPRGDDIVEWTRCVAEPGAADAEGISAISLVYTGVAEAFLALGLRGVIMRTHPKFVSRLIEAGWNVRPLNVPCSLEGKPLAVIFAAATAETVRISQSMCRRTKPVLAIETDIPHPTQPEASIRIVSHATYARMSGPKLPPWRA
ncbi:acyl-homoserine-lactone synthase [Jiella mangrovi]|uniref:Acyl-homoserine-lactone synthase n=1 Tax=Jiella mangrovi TaxID=2821407 RepID=A0ABS4BEU0_9HYPH|nr:acyl-homoserine-lactone synthase [Jiella mangrovi]MBP0615241.1 GNAT family N-acetyltransferase [Jiella mangrovi]